MNCPLGTSSDHATKRNPPRPQGGGNPRSERRQTGTNDGSLRLRTLGKQVQHIAFTMNTRRFEPPKPQALKSSRDSPCNSTFKPRWTVHDRRSILRQHDRAGARRRMTGPDAHPSAVGNVLRRPNRRVNNGNTTRLHDETAEMDTLGWQEDENAYVHAELLKQIEIGDPGKGGPYHPSTRPSPVTVMVNRHSLWIT